MYVVNVSDKYLLYLLATVMSLDNVLTIIMYISVQLGDVIAN